MPGVSETTGSTASGIILRLLTLSSESGVWWWAGLIGGGVVETCGLSGSFGKEKWKPPLSAESLEVSENIVAGSRDFIGFLAGAGFSGVLNSGLDTSMVSSLVKRGSRAESSAKTGSTGATSSVEGRGSFPLTTSISLSSFSSTCCEETWGSAGLVACSLSSTVWVSFTDGTSCTAMGRTSDANIDWLLESCFVKDEICSFSICSADLSSLTTLVTLVIATSYKITK